MRTKLRETEKVEFITQKHWIYLTAPAAAFVVILYIMFAGVPVIKDVLIIGLAVSFLMLIYRVFDRKFNIWAVTNCRVIDEWGVFTHNSKESPLDKINNVAHRQSIPGRILGYGIVQIQTAADYGATVFTMVPNPKELCEAIVSAQEKLKTAPQVALMQQAEGDKIECPYCAERIRAKALICRFCGKPVQQGAAKNVLAQDIAIAEPSPNNNIKPEKAAVAASDKKEENSSGDSGGPIRGFNPKAYWKKP